MTENKKKILGNVVSSKSRIIIASVITIFVGVGLISYFHHRSVIKQNDQASASVTDAPSIDSVPGAGNPSNEYVKDQNIQNQQLEANARKEATSAVPTITRPDFIGNPNAFGNLPNQTTSTGKSDQPKRCPIKKVVVMYKPNPASCTLDNLILARKAGVTAEELVCQGCSCPLIKDAGYTAGELKSIGYTAKQLRGCGFTLGQLIAAGYSPEALKNAGYTAKQLANDGFTPGQLASAGFNDQQIEQAGFTPAQLKAAGINGHANCDVSALRKARLAGVSAATLRKQGCGLAALKAAGFTAAQLKDAGFSAAQLRNAGFTAAQLKGAGFSAAQLKNAGFNNSQLKAAGFSPADIAKADAVTSNCSVSRLKKLREQGVSAVTLKNEGCGLAALKAAGFSAAELKNAGFTADQLKGAGFSAAQLKNAGFTAAELKKAGFSAAQLKNAGFSAAQLRNAGFGAAELKKAGFSAAQLKGAGFSASQLKDAGFSAAQLKKAGFSAAQLKNAGFSAGALKAAGFSAGALKAAGFTPKQLRNAGYSAAELKQAGFTPHALTQAGFTTGDLLRAGFTPAQAGYKLPAREHRLANTPVVSNNNDTDANPSGAGATMPSVDADTPEAKLARLAQIEQARMDAQQRADSTAQLQGNMTQQAQKLLSGWSNNSTQQLAQAPITNTSVNNNGVNGQNNNVDINPPLLKAGTVMFAVLDTSINSDENSPIMAHVVTGQLKGAKLLGQFTRVNKRLLITFNLINDPNYYRSIPVNAVAIDPDTARTAIAGQVNNHYLLRYGTLFASAFLEGISNAVLAGSLQQTCLIPGIGCTTQTRGNGLNTGEQVAVGLGTVGQRYAEHMGDNFNRPPTIKVGAGTGIGILLMSDLTLPSQTMNNNGVDYSTNGDNDDNGDDVNDALDQSDSNQVKSTSSVHSLLLPYAKK